MHLPPRAKLIGSSSHSRPTATHQARIHSRLIPYQLGTSRPQVRDVLTSAADATKSSRLGTTSVYPSSPFPSLVLIAPAERPLYNRLCTLMSRRRIRHMIDDPFIDFIQHCMLRGTLLFVLFIVNLFSRYRGISSTCME